MKGLRSYFNHNTKKKAGELHNNKRKAGFTLIEVISVICIICILIVVLLPKFTGYINEAKKLVVIDQSRKIIMAVESYNIKAKDKIKQSDQIENIKKNNKVMKYLEGENLDNIKGEITLEKCYKIINGEDFTLEEVTLENAS